MHIKMIIRGLLRRKKAVNVFLAAAFSAFFITAILLYSDNVEKYILENKFNNYGEWFMAVVNSKNPDFSDAIAILDGHPYLEKAGHITSMYTLERDENQILSGMFDERAMDMARFNVLEGRLPSKKGEAVITKSAFKKLGGVFSPGLELEFEYWGTRADQTINVRITGIIDDYSNWSETVTYPQIIFSENPFEGSDFKETAFYQIRKSFYGIDTKKLYDGLIGRLSKTGVDSKYIESLFVYNANAYDYSIWHTNGISFGVEAAVLAAGIIAILQVTYTYSTKRKPAYLRLYSLGASLFQVRTCIFIENVLICTLGQIAGIVVAVAASGALIYAVSLIMGMNFFYIFKFLTLIKIAAACIFSSIMAILPVTFSMAKNVAKSHNRHFVRQQTFVNGIFTLIMSTLIMLCTMNIYHISIEYRNGLRDDIQVYLHKILNEKMSESGTYTGRYTKSLYWGITDEELKEMTDDQSAIKKVTAFSTDQMHNYYWKGKENSALKKLSMVYDYAMYNIRNRISNVTYSLDMEIPKEIADNYEELQNLIVVYDCKEFFSVLNSVGVKIDKTAFEKGDCVVFCDGLTGANYSLLEDNMTIDGLVLDEFPAEETLHKGDTLYFDCEYGTVETEVGAKLTYKDVLQLPVSFSKPTKMYDIIDNIRSSGGYMGEDNISCHVICSPAFAQKLADAEGHSDYVQKYNVVCIEYDHLKNYEKQRDEIVKEFNQYIKNNNFVPYDGQFYYSNSDILDNSASVEENYSKYGQGMFLYVVFLIIMSLAFILIRENMVTLLKNTEHKNIVRYTLLGADKSFFRKKYFVEALKNAVFVLPGMIISTLYISYIISSKNNRTGIDRVVGACWLNLPEIIFILSITAAIMVVYIIVSEKRVYT